jgi:hypothetical protein
MGKKTNYNLLTFHGASNLCTLSTYDFQTQILNVTLHDGPLDLQPAQFNLSTARTDSTKLQADIESRILRLAFATVCNTLFLELCPGYSNQLHATINHICQVYNNCNGNQVMSTVQAYFQQLMGAAHPFSSQRNFPISVCAKFQDGLDPRLQMGYQRYFPQHSMVQSLNATHQRKTLQAMLQAAQQAKDNLHTIQRVARKAVGLSQAFHASALGGVPQGASAFPSQAEKTLVQYSPSGGYSPTDGSPATGGVNRGARPSPRAWQCFGCGGPHPYSELRDGTHVVICPNWDNPGVHENAAKNIMRMRKNRKKQHSQNTKRKNLGTANFLDFDKPGQQRIREQVLQSMGQEVSDHMSVASSVTTLSSVNQQGMLCGRGHGRGSGGGVILVADTVVLAAGTPLKRVMPISIQSNLPHITLLFGANLDCLNCPSICCAVDSCTTLMMGNFHFFAAVMKHFPHCVAKKFTPNNYVPIVLSGIFQSNAESMTTKLEVGFLFHLPYKTTDGNSASLMAATGPNVSVNTIIGLPFMKASGLILDLLNEVVECKYLDCPPFPVDFRRTLNHVPSITDDQIGTPAHHATSSSAWIQEIKNLECYYDAKVQAVSSLVIQNQAVQFGSRAVASAAAGDLNDSGMALHPAKSMATRWVPPSLVVTEDSDNYLASVLGRDRSL